MSETLQECPILGLEIDDTAEYPQEYINNPFPDVCEYQITLRVHLFLNTYYFRIKKGNPTDTALLWVDNHHHVWPNGNALDQIKDDSAISQILEENYVFRVSKQFTSIGQSPKLERGDDNSLPFRVRFSYIFIPDTHKERIKLLTFKGKIDEFFKWEWHKHLESCAFEMHKDLMGQVFDNSTIYRVSWDDEPFAVEF